jgi:hypothetical protein
MVEAGRIRAGEKGAKGEPRKLTKWRLTSKDRVRLEAAAGLWGGEVREWEEQFELYTETDALPIMLLPGHPPTTWYELWSKGGCQRRCDGQHEVISDSSCLCDDDERECKPYTRLSVLLPDLPGIGSWLLTSKGWHAAAELAGAADLLQRASAQGVLVPARLRLQQEVKVKEGQTQRFVKPVIDIDVSFRELLGAQGALGMTGSQRALPQGYTPLPPGNGEGTSLRDGLRIAETQEPKRTARSTPPIPEDDIPFGEEDAPAEAGEPPSPGSETADSETAPQSLSDEEHKQKLNALVGQLRRSGAITTEQLYAAIAKSRGIDAAELPTGASGARRWSILRDDLTSAELANLHGRLGRLWATTQGDAA